MATLMEKDVLMELATGTIALMRKHRDKETNENREKTKDFYYHLLGSKPKDIDYKESLIHIQEIRKKYERIQ